MICDDVGIVVFSVANEFGWFVFQAFGIADRYIDITGKLSH